MCNIDEVHKIELMILDKFIDICKKHNLQWFADSGTLLGAIRKGRMIPWDDDIDVIMPRKDYNKLLTLSNEFKHPFFLQTPLTDEYWNITCKLRYSDSAFFSSDKYSRNEYDNKCNRGIFIDIFVYDNVPLDEDEFDTAQSFLRFMFCFSSIKKYGTKQFEANYNPKDVFSFMNDSISKISEKNEASNYVANLFFNYQKKYRNFKISKAAYSSYKEIHFEGLRNKLRIPVGYEEILKLWYGDDWTVEKKINSTHGVGAAFYDTKNSYKKYENLSFEEYMKLFD